LCCVIIVIVISIVIFSARLSFSYGLDTRGTEGSRGVSLLGGRWMRCFVVIVGVFVTVVGRVNYRLSACC
jgi:hypothetical protein